VTAPAQRSDARRRVLNAVRRHLDVAVRGSRPAGEAPPAGPTPGTPAGLDSPAARLERFCEVLSGVGGHLRRATAADAGEALGEILTGLGARSAARSDAALLKELLDPPPAGLDLREHGPGPEHRARLLEVDVGLSGAQWGVAETGTLVLDSGAESSRLVSLVPPVHVALLPASRIVGTLGELLDAARPDPEVCRATGASRSLTFITGPSRTADIELTLVVGVHGPEQLHVLVLEDR
jgi:L-lactate utilization protein LutC